MRERERKGLESLGLIGNLGSISHYWKRKDTMESREADLPPIILIK